MAPEKEGGRTRRKAGAARADGGRAGRTVEGGVERGGGVTMVDIDPWGSFFEKFWEQAAEGESGGGHEGERKPAETTRRPTKTGKQGRSSRTP